MYILNETVLYLQKKDFKTIYVIIKECKLRTSHVQFLPTFLYYYHSRCDAQIN